LGCDLLFGLGPFFFFFSCSLARCFSFIHLFIHDIFSYTHHARTQHFTPDGPWEWPIPMFGPPLDSPFVFGPLLLALAMPMPLRTLCTVIMENKHVITRRWQIGRYFITYYARHPTFSQKGGTRKA
jgi:hypothetical protein